MINLERFFEIQFDDRTISRQQLRKFTEDHLQRLAAQNTNNQYDEMMNQTETTYGAFFGSLNDHDTGRALQQSRTKSMNNVLEAFQAKVRQRAGLIKNFYSEDSPEYQEFFPLGLTEYRTATLENVSTLMTRMATACSNHADKLGNDVIVEFNGFVTSFSTARGNQLQQKGRVSSASEAADSSRNALEIQLTKNVLTLALQNTGNTEALSLFFDQSILQVPQNGNGKNINGSAQVSA